MESTGRTDRSDCTGAETGQRKPCSSSICVILGRSVAPLASMRRTKSLSALGFRFANFADWALPHAIVAA